MFTFDYVKLVVRNDGAKDHQEMAAEWLSLAEKCSGDKKSHSVSVVAQKGGATSATVVELWGKAADQFAAFMPNHWWCYLRRLDIREVVQPLGDDSDALALDWAFLARPRNVNTAALDSKPRHKNNKRDVGGRGLVIGSRKSARHAVFYKRGSEPAVYEFRAQDQLALEIGRAAAKEADGTSDAGPYEKALNLALVASDAFLRKYYGSTNPARIYNEWARQAAEHDEQLEGLVAATSEPDFWSIAADEYPDLPGLYEFPDSPADR